MLITYGEFLKRSKGSDPFSIPNGTEKKGSIDLANVDDANLWPESSLLKDFQKNLTLNICRVSQGQDPRSSEKSMFQAVGQVHPPGRRYILRSHDGP